MSQYERSICLSGRDLTEDIRAEGEVFLDRMRKQGRRRVEGEMQKTAKDKRYVVLANSFLEETFIDLGLENPPHIIPSQVHILNEDDFYSEYSSDKYASYQPQRHAIYIASLPTQTDIQRFTTVLHEAFELASFQSFYAEVKQMLIANYRVGYAITHPLERDHEHFHGFKEAVIDKMILELLHTHRENIKTHLKIPEEEIDSLDYRKDFRGNFIDIVDTVIEGVAKHKGEGEEQTWRRVKRGLFSGDMMHLRDIERSFGKGSLRVLAALGSATKNYADEEITSNIHRYFTTDDAKEKQVIIMILFSTLSLSACTSYFSPSQKLSVNWVPGLSF